MSLDLRSSELEHAFIKDRINYVEKHFSEISSKLSSYIKKTANLRDSGDDLAKCILSYVSKENLNLSLRNSLTQFADILLALQEYRDAQVQRTDVKVLLEFANYNTICKKAKVDLKSSFEICTKEITKKNQLEKTRSKNPSNWQKIAQAEKEVTQAKDDSTRATRELSRKMDRFEQQKMEDIQHAFLEFIKIEMIFHAKAIELYTKAYNGIKNAKLEDDLKEFRSHFRSYTLPVEQESLIDDSERYQNETVIDTSPLKKNPDNGTDLNLSAAKVLDTSTKSAMGCLPLKRADGSQKSNFSSRTSISRKDNPHTSYDSLTDSKFEFKDHCV